MEFYVNDEKIDITLENEKTVGDVLKAFELTCSQNNCATIGIQIDGNDVLSDNFDEACKKELKADTKINVAVVSQTGIEENFKMTASQMEEIITELKNIPVDLAAGKTTKANQTIINLTNIMTNFCTTASWASLFPERFSNILVDGQAINEFFLELDPILNDFSAALENSDTVLIGDLCEYEICPRIEKLAKTLKSI